MSSAEGRPGLLGSHRGTTAGGVELEVVGAVKSRPSVGLSQLLRRLPGC